MGIFGLTTIFLLLLFTQSAYSAIDINNVTSILSDDAVHALVSVGTAFIGLSSIMVVIKLLINFLKPRKYSLHQPVRTVVYSGKSKYFVKSVNHRVNPEILADKLASDKRFIAERNAFHTRGFFSSWGKSPDKITVIPSSFDSSSYFNPLEPEINYHPTVHNDPDDDPDDELADDPIHSRDDEQGDIHSDEPDEPIHSLDDEESDIHDDGREEFHEPISSNRNQPKWL